MFVRRIREKSSYDRTWEARCIAVKVSPNAVYKAEPFPNNPEMIRVFLSNGLRLYTGFKSSFEIVNYGQKTSFKDLL